MRDGGSRLRVDVVISHERAHLGDHVGNVAWVHGRHEISHLPKRQILLTLRRHGMGKDEAVHDTHREPKDASRAPGGEREDTTGPDEPLLIAAPEQFKALAHPLRQRMLFALGERATISQLASALTSNK